jgi:hypothetical protein
MSATWILREGEYYIIVVCDWCQLSVLLCDPEGTEYYEAEELNEAIRRNGWHTSEPRGIRCDMCADCWTENMGEDEP